MIILFLPRKLEVVNLSGMGIIVKSWDPIDLYYRNHLTSTHTSRSSTKRHRELMKRRIEKVRKWDKRWVNVAHMKIYKWVLVDSKPEINSLSQSLNENSNSSIPGED